MQYCASAAQAHGPVRLVDHVPATKSPSHRTLILKFLKKYIALERETSRGLSFVNIMRGALF